MQVYTDYNIAQFSTFVFDLAGKEADWCLIDVVRASSSDVNIAFMAYRINLVFHGREGIAVICNDSNVFCLVKRNGDEPKTLKAMILKALPINAAKVGCSDVNEEVLQKLSQRVKFMDVTKINEGLHYLRDKRRARKNNVVLIADDDPLIRSLIDAGLSPHASVYESKDGSDAVSLYLEYLPDIVFLDIHMPGKSGIDILREIIRYDPDAHCIMLSADAVKDKVVGTHQIGSKGFIVKPFSRQKIEAAFMKAPTVRK